MKKQLLYWVDIVEKQLCIFNPTANTNRVIALNQQIGCVVPYLDDVLLLAMENGFYSINVETEKLTHIFDPEPHLFKIVLMMENAIQQDVFGQVLQIHTVLMLLAPCIV